MFQVRRRISLHFPDIILDFQRLTTFKDTQRLREEGKLILRIKIFEFKYN